MQPSNPFLFIPQIGTLLLLLGLSAACAERQPMLRPTFNGDMDLLINPASTDERYRSFNDGAGVTSSEPLGSPMTSPCNDPLKDSAYGTIGSGHGGVVKMQPSNPFLFIPQIGTLLLLLGLSAACAERQPMLRPTFNGDMDLLINPASTDERYRSFNDGAGVTSSEPLGSPMTSPLKKNEVGIEKRVTRSRQK
ncbi:hypothetical protein MRX96_003466 [Rhipicephalus microplus]